MKKFFAFKIIASAICIFIILNIIFIILVYLNFITLNSRQDIIKYNNNFLNDRNLIVSEIETLTISINQVKTREEIEKNIQNLDNSITIFNQKLEKEETPRNAKQIKEDFIKYSQLAKDISLKASKYITNLETEEKNIKQSIDEFNSALNMLNQQNSVITNDVNELVGYEAISTEKKEKF